MSPYIGVDGDNKEFDSLLLEWSAFLKDLIQVDCQVRTAHKYDVFMIRGTYLGLIHKKHTICFHQRNGKLCFEVGLVQCPGELEYALEKKGFIINAP
jgi:hypothetical protein